MLLYRSGWFVASFLLTILLGTSAHGATKYPILLVHGVALKNETLGVHYFGRIPETLRQRGNEVFDANPLAWGSYEDNADLIYQDLLTITDDFGHDKVNIIAHSKGGLDVRYMMWKYQDEGISERVASITTLNSPHEGAATADSLFRVLPLPVKKLVESVSNLVGWFQGEMDADAWSVYEQMKSDRIQAMNRTIGNPRIGLSQVYTQSWNTVISGPIPDKFLYVMSKVNNFLGHSDNDGMVQKGSSVFGLNRGTITTARNQSISHFGIVDRGYIFATGGTPGFDARNFFIDITHELEVYGY
ncbi:esterase/lipase family protein [Pseudobacteriovorax antillogorgiicola]|uniref:AB hydrolase-1 domain-containing protein n=1 Tax=Pseudobacteriovorax antillogorgiicola TaxID=1513793 RepID=A0A1Y6BKA9_9BACT|nr:alpha/beta fold hydrolase [Pseudobacteriovorax antillogorgiicola]TCS56315.1 hypothetical protein EDD56_104137 [Pseudobacteriovorax antillogorgiicola]SMF07165.1 hypothetical protein SAMN06296036_104196 [Pseudobacteriovorax antillogorgiicola]